MFQIKNSIKNPITYKILVDIFFVTLLIISGFIIAETILPGLISAYISPFLLFISIFLIIIVISFVARKQHIHTNITKSKKVLLALSILLFTIFISIASLNYGYFFGSIIIILSITTFILFYYIVKDILHKK